MKSIKEIIHMLVDEIDDERILEFILRFVKGIK